MLLQSKLHTMSEGCRLPCHTMDVSGSQVLNRHLCQAGEVTSLRQVPPAQDLHRTQLQVCNFEHLLETKGCLIFLQASGRLLDEDGEQGDTLKGMLLFAHLNIDSEGKELPWPIPAIGFGNGAHLARACMRCSSQPPPEHKH